MMYRIAEKELLLWKNRTDRKPLLLYGARQVGKTFLLLNFGKEHYRNTVYVNFEERQDLHSVFAGNLQPDRILRLLEAVMEEEILPGETLLILDEIQNCPAALTALKYFCEKTPEYHIAAAGSLLGVALQRGGFSFPVGKVQSLVLYPLTFEEFLLADGKQELLLAIRGAYESGEAMPAILHSQALEWYRYYLVVGGMPAAVKKYLQEHKLVGVPGEQQEILRNYVGDMAKYASSSESVKIRAAFDSVPAQLAKDNKKFQYKLAQRGGTSAVFGVPLAWLAQSGIVLQCWRLEHGLQPLEVYKDLAAFKLYMGDVGLLLAKSGLGSKAVLLNESNTFMGALTENYVAQQLVVKGYPLYYWAPSGSEAEVDFVLNLQGEVVPLECKSGVHNQSRSLGIFCQKYNLPKAVRISGENFYQTNNVRCIPLYALFCLPAWGEVVGEELCLEKHNF